MNCSRFALSFSCWLSFALPIFGIACEAHAATPPAPKILTTRSSGTNLLVTVNVPRGWRAVVLESREQTNSGAWVPRAISRLTGRVAFKVPASVKRQFLRVRGELRETLPTSFYRGRHVFAGRKSSFLRPDQGNGAVFTVAADGSLPGTILSVPVAAGPGRTIEESDIWKLSGDTLYFFNQLRGLQIIDISNPDAPVIKATLELPAVGEQMYLLDAGHVVLLARDSCGTGWDSRLIVVDVSGPAPQTLATLPVNGWIDESRLVGTALYVASEGYGSGTNSSSWGTVVASFDLSNPASPTPRSSLFYPGYANAVLATDRWLFVATTDYSGNSLSVVRVLDCSAADGTLLDTVGIPTSGQVDDKFKMNLAGDVFAVISESYQWTDIYAGAWTTTLQTFSLANPSAPSLLGSLDLDRSNRLFATRFDGTRAYVSTFFEVDPIRIVDLSDPANPVAAGSVEVPGYSTYIQPMGDRLLTLGAETNQVALALFNVQDPGHPSLLSQVPLGENDSWSEALYDEKALTVLTNLGLVLVPYQGTTSNGWTSKVQIIDFDTDSLTARGTIEHQFAPRRTAEHQGRILSISNEELLSVNIIDQDHPTVMAESDLAWSVNQLFVQDGYLLELATGSSWLGAAQPQVRVAATAAPDTTLASLPLGNLPIAGSALRDGRLFLLQNPNSYYYPLVLGFPGFNGDGGVSTNLLMTVVDVSALPSIRVLGTTALAPEGAVAVSGSFQALWPATNLLVWFGTGFDYWITPLLQSVPGSVAPVTGGGFSVSGVGGISLITNRPKAGVASPLRARSLAPSPLPSSFNSQPLLSLPCWRPWWGNGGARLLAFDVSDPANPQPVSSITFNPTNAWGFSSPCAARGMIFFSHEQSDHSSGWQVRDCLDVIDYADPTDPTARPSLGIPGQLAGVSDDGAMLYLLGNALSASGLPYQNRDALNACSYDGTAAYLVASLALPQTWPQPVLVNNGSIFLGRTSTNTTGNSLEIWNLSAQGRFARQGVAALDQAPLALAVFGNLLAVQDINNTVTLFDAADPSAMRQLGQGSPLDCLWFDLNHAAGALDSGLWLPLDNYGVSQVRPRD